MLDMLRFINDLFNRYLMSYIIVVMKLVGFLLVFLAPFTPDPQEIFGYGIGMLLITYLDAIYGAQMRRSMGNTEATKEYLKNAKEVMADFLKDVVEEEPKKKGKKKR